MLFFLANSAARAFKNSSLSPFEFLVMTFNLFVASRNLPHAFLKILIASILMGIFFNYLIHFFNDKFVYEEILKSAYLMGLVILGLTLYILVAIFIKAFKISDIHLKY